MRLSTRLLLFMLPVVVIVMSAFGALFIFERETLVVPEVRQQTRAYARAMDIAFEYGLNEMESSRIQGFLNRMSADPRVFGVIVYDTMGMVRYRSSGLESAAIAPDTLLRRILDGEDETSFERQIDDRVMFVVLRSIRAPDLPATRNRKARRGAVIGALEAAQPYDLLMGEVRRTQVEIIAFTIALMVALSIVLVVLTRRTVARPLERLVSAARALGEGDIDARVPQSLGAAEPNALAREFNMMAARLGSAQREQARDAEQRVQLERRLAEAEKLATVGTLAAGLAHEIGAPLNVISGRAELLLRQQPSDETVTRNLQSIVAQTSRITRTVRSLLDYARRPARRDDAVHLSEVIDATLDMLETELSRSGVVVHRREHYDAWVRGDQEQLQQVLTNLFVNAMQAMEGQSDAPVITVGVEARKEHPSDTHAEAVLTVCDNGPGLPEELQGQLFSPFTTTKPGGTGLGLVVARSIVQDHGGTLAGTMRRDGRSGAEFTIWLPLAAAPTVGEA